MRKMRLPNDLEVFCLNPAETTWVYKEVFVQGCYLRHGLSLAAGACVFDVGANIGLFAVQVGQLVPGARIVAFEPIPAIVEVLRANVALHALDATVYDCGLAESEGHATFTFYPRNTVMSGRHSDPAEDRRMTHATMVNERGADVAARAAPLLDAMFKPETVDCRLRRLSDVVRELGVTRIDLLKIDVEKSEAEVLAGIDPADWPKIGQLAIEVHDLDGRVAAVRHLLESHGFTVAVDQDAALAGTNLFGLYARRA